jgi:hypothetical protein
MRKFIPLFVVVVAVIICAVSLTTSKVDSANFVPADIAAITSDIIQDVVTVNPYTEQTKTYTEVRQLRIKARTAIAVRVAFDDATTSDSYYVLSSGESLPLTNLYLSTVTVKLKGDSTATDTGSVSIIIGK